MFEKKDIISISDLNSEQILYLCNKANEMKQLEKSNNRYGLSSSLKNKKMAYMFYEPSTRTKLSFDTAMSQLGGKRDGFSGVDGTSVKKNESIMDTVKMMEANHFDVIVMRNPIDGSVQWAADVAKIPVINGGDGKNEHPTQSLLDIFTLYSYNNGVLDGLKIGFGGDLSHGRTVRSLSLLLSHFKDISIHWAAEDFLGLPQELIDLLELRGVKVIRHNNVEEVLENVDFYYMTRPQLERMKGVDNSQIMRMIKKYKIDAEKIKNFNGKLLHPMPVNSELEEIENEVYFSNSQGFLVQAENGIFTRKALLFEILNNTEYTIFDSELSSDLLYGNNKLQRKIDEKVKEGLFIDNLNEGLSIDHLEYGAAFEIAAKLSLADKGYVSMPAHLPPTSEFEGKSFLKTNMENVSERELKSISIISNEPTINVIKNGKVIDKFVYLLCRNSNCIVRDIKEDVPPKFYFDNGIKCRYCRQKYEIRNRKIKVLEINEYIKNLPKGMIENDLDFLKNKLLETGAFKDLDKPVIFTSGELGIYYNNTEKLCRDGGKFKDYGEDSLGMINHCIAMMDDLDFAKVIQILSSKAKEILSKKPQPWAISGGQRRDWIFSGPVAKVLGLPHISLYKQTGEKDKLEVIMPDGSFGDLVEGTNAVHIVDLITLASSVFRIEDNMEKGWVPMLRNKGINVQDVVAVADRMQKDDRLDKIGVNLHSFVEINEDFLNEYSDNVDRNLFYLRDPLKWHHSYLSENGALDLVDEFDPAKGKLDRAKKFLKLYGEYLDKNGKLDELYSAVKEKFGVDLDIKEVIENGVN